MRAALLRAAGAGQLLARLAEAERSATDWRDMAIDLADRNTTLRRQLNAHANARKGW